MAPERSPSAALLLRRLLALEFLEAVLGIFDLRVKRADGGGVRSLAGLGRAGPLLELG